MRKLGILLMAAFLLGGPVMMPVQAEAASSRGTYSTGHSGSCPDPDCPSRCAAEARAQARLDSLASDLETKVRNTLDTDCINNLLNAFKSANLGSSYSIIDKLVNAACEMVSDRMTQLTQEFAPFISQYNDAIDAMNDLNQMIPDEIAGDLRGYYAGLRSQYPILNVPDISQAGIDSIMDVIFKGKGALR